MRRKTALRLPMCLFAISLSACCLLADAPLRGAAAQAASFAEPRPLEYSVLEVTLETSPRQIRRTLRAKGYLPAKRQIRNGIEVRSFTAGKKTRLYEHVHVAACPETAQTVGIYAVGSDGPAMLTLAEERYGLSGFDLVREAGKDRSPGVMRPGPTYRKNYANVSVSFYRNKGFQSYTLAFESPEAMAVCRRQKEENVRIEAELRDLIKSESKTARAVD